MLNINHDTHVPSYFTYNQILVHLAFILSPQLGEQALEKIALDSFEEEDEEPEMMAQEEEEPNMVQEEEDPDMVMQEKEDSDLEMLDGPLSS